MSSPPPVPTVMRGEVWEADFDPARGREQGGRRPCLVISNNRFNQSAMDLVIVLPITTSQRTLNSRVPITPPEGGLREPSDVLCQHIRTLSKGRLSRCLGDVTPATLARVRDAVRRILAL